nr:MAG TPA: hypothetical protein [Bacteriophage sp.]
MEKKRDFLQSLFSCMLISLLQPYTAVFLVSLVFPIYVYNNRCIVTICSLTAVVLRIYILFLQ